ncbi:MAG: hypothetical protein GXN96_02430 [Aquificae bacterium]|nr:hypothetical protein [Aquificota bacterium]
MDYGEILRLLEEENIRHLPLTFLREIEEFLENGSEEELTEVLSLLKTNPRFRVELEKLFIISSYGAE